MLGYLVLNTTVGIETDSKDWPAFFKNPLVIKTLRGGSAVGKARSFQNGVFKTIESNVDGYFIFETTKEDELQEILKSIPIVKAGGRVTVLALIEE